MKLGGKQLESLLPHRRPILMLEGIVDVVPRESGTGIREFRKGDACFEGHFPGMPILPGVLVIEAFAQTAMAVFLAEVAVDDTQSKLGLLVKVKEMEFLEKIVPGRKVEFSIKVDRHVGPFSFVSCEASEDGIEFAKGQITLKIGN